MQANLLVIICTLNYCVYKFKNLSHIYKAEEFPEFNEEQSWSKYKSNANTWNPSIMYNNLPVIIKQQYERKHNDDKNNPTNGDSS